MVRQAKIILSIVFILNCISIINTQYIPSCESLNDIDNNDHNQVNEEIKSRRVRALCDAIYSSRNEISNDELDKIPDFDLNHIDSDNDANQILKRFRRSRFSSGSSSSRSSGSSSRSSSSFSRSGSSGSSLFGGSRSSSSSSGGSSRFFGGSRSSSSSGSRIFSRSSGSSTGSGSSSGSRFFSRSGSSSSSSGSGSRWFGRNSGSSSSSTGSRGGIFSRPSSSSSSSSSKGNGHRVRQAIRSIIRKPSSPGSGIPSTSGGLSGSGGSKPGLSDQIRKITHGSGGTRSFGPGGNRYTSGMSGGGSFMGGSGGSGSSSWVRAGKKFLPVAVRFGKRYYQRRKYSKGMYAGMGAGAGYYAGSRMSGHHGNYYPDNYYGYPPVVNDPPEVNGKPPTVFYCIQEDLNTTLVNQTLNSEGFGVCNISGALVTCPIEIECKTSEADNCCEDEQGAPMCCGGPIPDEYASQYGGYGDDLYDTAEGFNKILNIITAMSALLATICFTMWRREE